MKFSRPVLPPKQYYGKLTKHTRTSANMIPQKGLTKETMENPDPNDTMIATDVVGDINDIALDRLIDSEYTNHEA